MVSAVHVFNGCESTRVVGLSLMKYSGRNGKNETTPTMAIEILDLPIKNK